MLIDDHLWRPHLGFNSMEIAIEPPIPRRPRGWKVRAGTSVLLVDDDPILIGAIRRRLERLGCRVVCATTVEEATALLDLVPFDLLLSDLRIGEGSGLVLLQRLRRLGLGTRAILMSGDMLEFERAEALALGASTTVNKPFGVGELDAALERALGPWGTSSP
jgi:two-component system, response regulator RegA